MEYFVKFLSRGMTLFDAFKSIPINIWSVVLGSIIAFGGVLISNKSHAKRLKIQLEHDSKLKAIERKATMRREVYLNAAEELVRANSYLGSLTQLDLTKINIGDELQNFFVSFAKLGLVAEEETGRASSELMIAYSDVLFKMMAKVIPINDQKTQIAIINKHYDETQVEIKRLLAEMRHQNESVVQDEQVFNKLDASFKVQQEIAKDMADKRNECWNKINEYTKKFALELMDEMKAITNLQVPVMIGVRKELEIDTDIESYKELINRNTEQVKEQLDSFLASLGGTA